MKAKKETKPSQSNQQQQSEPETEETEESSETLSETPEGTTKLPLIPQITPPYPSSTPNTDYYGNPMHVIS